MGIPKADRKRHGFNFVVSLGIRVARGVRAVAACNAVAAGVCRTPATVWYRDDAIEAVSEVFRILAEGAGPTVTLLADERERVPRRFRRIFVGYVFQGECACSPGSLFSAPDAPLLRHLQCVPASCITFLSEQAFAPQNTRYWSRRRVWFQFTVGEDKPPMLSVDNRGKGVLSMDCSAKRSPL